MKAVKIVVGVLCILFGLADLLASAGMRINRTAPWSEVVLQGSIGVAALVVAFFLLKGAFAKPPEKS